MEKKICQRCGKMFICMPNNIEKCQCATAKLNEKQRIYLKQHYTDCLCINCLLEIKRIIT